MADKTKNSEEIKIDDSNMEKPRRLNNPWMLSTTVLAIIAVVLLILTFASSGITGKAISENQAGQKTVSFVKDIYKIDVTLKDTSTEGNLYKIDLLMDDGSPVTLYTTKDFSFMKLPNGYWVSVLEVREQAAAYQVAEGQASTPAEVVKSDKPEVELFVMTHCPYGTQAEKGFIPAIEALGGTINAKIRFVHYFMHGDVEEQETYAETCIREEQSSKFINYLKCFLETGDSTNCVTKIGVDKTKLDSCVSSGKGKEYYEGDKTLSEGYGVRGSPTLIINGGEAEFYPRSPSNALSVICSAFNTEPDQCSLELSADNPATGFGTSSSSSDTTAGSCV
ncbi:hypothetical protein COV15_01475 [Candidatus Woesearchaeota archaeon CG10_big_fil_rev_8_21_14_0_10_34_12]|nr:MAG: hypothetical protein COV15_01475 [Candidatus Woesearchaeota archaeon CG10_big_fil_rev_8_21_14_0_10_34_12]